MRTLLAIAAAGCLGEPTPGTTTLSPRRAWDALAWPALATCVGCHGGQPAIDFLAPGTANGAYATVLAYQPPIVDVASPAASLLLSTGKHTGPALEPAQATAVLAWLETERDARAPDTGPGVRVGPVLPEPGRVVVIELPVGGAKLLLAPAASARGLYFTRVAVLAGSGVALSHPLFVSRPPDPVLDPVDRFAGVDLVLAAGQTAELGAAWFLDFDPADYLSIHFQTLEAP